MEPLEDRCVLAATTVAVGATGILNIFCDGGNDDVKVALVGTNLAVTDNSGVGQAKPTWTFAAASVTRVSFWGSSGNDKLDGTTVNTAIMADGGSGNDTLLGGTGIDTLLGNVGNDLIRGYAGNDFLCGNDGNDKIFGGVGNDSVYGGAGDDFVDGGVGSNFLDGQSGFDFRGDTWAPNGATFGDIQQKNSATCVLLASMGAAAYSGVDLGSRIGYSGDGNYTVKLFVANLWTDVPVYFDGTINTQSDPAAITENESWVILYQRAYLARVTSFQNERAALSATTGKLTNLITTKSGNPVDADFDIIAQAVVARKAITAGTSYTPSEITDSRIVASHMYTVVGTSIVNGQKYIRVRNPWGVTDLNSNNGELDIAWANFKHSFTVYHYV